MGLVDQEMFQTGFKLILSTQACVGAFAQTALFR